MKSLEEYIINIPDFPEEGIMFRDVTGILNESEGFKLAIDNLAEKLNDLSFDIIAGIESRGFIFGAPLAYMFKKPFVPIRKKGKLPREVISKEYELEYGTSAIEIHKDAVRHGQKVVIIDDLIATGGTVKAATELIEELGGNVVKLLFIIELEGLNGRRLLEKYDVDSIIKYEGA